MNYIESLSAFGIDAKEIPCILGAGTPTASTVGAVGLLYMDRHTSAMYKCIAVSDGVYTWISGDVDLSEYAKKEEIPKKASDIGALPDTYTPPNQTAEQVGADPKGTADTAVSQHNTSEDSHNDIRLALKAINDRLTAFFDSDDSTLDELSEIVAYITSNKTLIEAITTSKVGVADIVNNLTTNAANKPLSAAQGVVLKGLIDAVSNSLSDYALKSAIPTKVSQLTNDAGYLTQHQDISGKLDRTELPSAINTALAQAAASGAFDGKDGRGIKSIVRTSGNGAAGTTDTYTITYTDNTTGTLTVYNGKNGSNGTSVTVKSVSESTADGGSNVVTFSDGTTIIVKNGKTGTPGKTPVYGVDYGTPAQIEEIVQKVITALGTPIFGRIEDGNKIITTGNLAAGTYEYWYEDENGKQVLIGTLDHDGKDEPTYTNVLPLAIDSSKNPYNGGKGWKSGTRLNSSGAESTSNAAEIEVTGFIPVKNGDKVYLSGITMNNGTYANQTYAWLYDATFTKLNGRYRLFSQYDDTAQNNQVAKGTLALDSNRNVTMLTISGGSNANDTFCTGTDLGDMNNVAYLRISCEHIDDNSIITVNEPIV